MMTSDLMLNLAKDRHRDLIDAAAKHRMAVAGRRPRRWVKKWSANQS